MKRILPFAVLMSAVLCACNGQNSAPPARNELPVSKVIMYQSGIGYVERSADFEGDELVLRIRPDQINDILKSLTVIDHSNGRPVSISLPVDRDTLDSLAQIPDQIIEGGIRALIVAFRGAHVQIKTRGRSFEGRIVGFDDPYEDLPSNVKIDALSEQDATVTLKTKGDVLEIISLKDIKSISLFDKNLSEGLDKSLNVSLNEGDWKQLELKIRMDSRQKRKLSMSYLISMPTWKPAYRLILGKENTAILQGWAIISNVTGSDWNEINFSLVSGQPMSFTYDLYTPQFIERPDLSGLAVQKATAPKVVQSGYAAEPKAAPAPMNAMAMGMAAAKSRSAEMAESRKAAVALYDEAEMPAADEESMAMDMAEMEDIDYVVQAPKESGEMLTDKMVSNFQALASKNQIGAFDEYPMAAKLSVPDGSTALVNLIQHKLPAHETRFVDSSDIPYSLFEPFEGKAQISKSWQTIELKNDSNFSLDAGPITLYRDDAVIGEGYLTRTEQSATAYITFASEGRLTAEMSNNMGEKTYRLNRFENGVCNYTIEENRTSTFAMTSHIPNDVTVVLQLPKRSATWTPLNFPENTVETASSWNVSVEVPANGKVDLPLTVKNSGEFRGERTKDCRTAIQNAIDGGLIGEDSAALFKQYLEALDKREEINLRLGNIKSQLNSLHEEERTLARSLAGLKDIKGANANALKEQFIARQKDNEKRLADKTTEQYALQGEKSDIDLMIRSLEPTLKYSVN